MKKLWSYNDDHYQRHALHNSSRSNTISIYIDRIVIIFDSGISNID